MNNKLFKFIIEFKWVLIIPIALIAILFTLSVFDNSVTKWQNGIEEKIGGMIQKTEKFLTTDGDTIITTVDTIAPITIKRIEETGEIYTLNAEIEEMCTTRKTVYKKIKIESIMIDIDKVIDSTTYVCVETLKQKCFFKFKLSDVEYCVVPDSQKIYVLMPKMKYEATNISSEFIPDDQKFWSKFDNNKMKKECKNKIRKSFCTEENKKLAKDKAEYIVEGILSQFGYDVWFVEHDLERYKAPERYKEIEKTIKKSDFFSGKY